MTSTHPVSHFILGAAGHEDHGKTALITALTGTINGLYKTEVIHRQGPWHGLDHVEFATLAWGDWFNKERLLEPIGYIPPVEFEELYYQSQECPATVAGPK